MARTRAADFEDKRRAILLGAAAVFAQEGMEKASMAMVAARADVSKSLLYHYYPGKDALIFDIIRDHLTRLEAAVAGADDASLPLEARLKALVGAVLDAYKGADDQHKVQLNAINALSDEQRGEITAIERRIVRRFSAVLREIHPPFTNEARELLAPTTMSLFGMLNWAYMWFREGGAMTRADYAELATTLLLKGLKGLPR